MTASSGQPLPDGIGASIEKCNVIDCVGKVRLLIERRAIIKVKRVSSIFVFSSDFRHSRIFLIHLRAADNVFEVSWDNWKRWTHPISISCIRGAGGIGKRVVDLLLQLAGNLIFCFLVIDVPTGVNVDERVGARG